MKQTILFIMLASTLSAQNRDNLRLSGYLEVDSIHCRTIKVGHSWSVNDGGPTYGATRPFDQQTQSASDNIHVFEGDRFSTATIAQRDNVRVLVGYLSASNGPQHRFNVHSNNNLDVFASFTNINSYATTIASTDGFKVGIQAGGIAELNQQENLDMIFLTNSAQRAVIKASGRIGAGTSTPGNRLEISSATGDPYFSTANSSGLRFTNLTSASTPVTNPGINVLSVDANGDVILVPDAGSAGINAKNGLNVLTGDVELGGTLLHNTVIDQQTYNMINSNAGIFSINSDPLAAAPVSNARLDVAAGKNFQLLPLSSITLILQAAAMVLAMV